MLIIVVALLYWNMANEQERWCEGGPFRSMVVECQVSPHLHQVRHD